MDNWSFLGRLKRAVKKVRFLLCFNIHRWRLASVIGIRRRVSFNDRPGLMACVDDDNSSDEPGSSSSRRLSRTMSCPSSEDDVDKRAEMFIANFYRQLRMERQVSLELKYYRGNSFGSVSPSP